jgi:hypothetical protein
MKLVVTTAFGDYAVGAQLTDGEACAKALAEHPEKVVPVSDENSATEPKRKAAQ